MTNVNSDKAAESTSTPSKQAGAHRSSSSGLPLRGFAMVLIAVAVMLGMWGLYTLTSKDSTDTAQTGSTGVATLPAPAEGEPGAQGGPSAQPGAAGSAARGTQDAKAGQDAAGQPAKEGQDAAGREAANKDGAAAGAAGAESAAGAERAAKDIPVNVFNNSGRANFAAEQADKLKDEGFKIGEVGNLAGDILTVPQTTVYFPAGDKDAERLARETAAQLYGAQSIPEGAIAEYPAELKAEFTKGNAVVAVLAIPQA
ncbi:lytR cell envelope-related transcriptional attenuator family protein [Corynebacterium simulans]|uniref:LytR C-terminal domain-containing protein n=1 Tax=Corynebacterium simulans TaxID=146827 RepID=UPI0007859938|nr:LytR C-terminal domain-containing protein [Corynebacterium simulans]AMO89443.1 lytR cell envelope-related transcriptional attenuator family protein [Corynebacterium simulans]